MRIISMVLIWSLLYTMAACYSTKQIHQNDEILKALYRGEELYVYTKDSRYKYESASYIVRKDTLYGIVQNTKNGNDTKDLKLGLREIRYIEKINYDADKTTILLGAGVVMVLVIGGYMYAVASYNGPF